MASKRNKRRKARSVCSKKRPYASQDEALQSAMMLRKKTGDGNIDAYRCEQCGLWHVGHRPAYLQALIEERRDQ